MCGQAVEYAEKRSGVRFVVGLYFYPNQVVLVTENQYGQYLLKVIDELQRK